MKAKLPRARVVYMTVLGLIAVLCLAFGVLWLRHGQASTQTAPRYLLKDSGGHPALYTADGAGPLASYDEIYTRLLPESDAAALQQGVLIQDEAELQQRLEDYGL